MSMNYDEHAKLLLPEWQSIEGPCHATPRFNYPVAAKDCRAAVSKALAEKDAEIEGRLKDAFVAGCCAVLTWTHSAMPQDDLDEAGYDYVANLRATTGGSRG